MNILDELIPEPGSLYVMDRAYIDFERLYLINQCGAFFVVRAKSNLKFHRIKQHLRIKAFYGTPENAEKTQIWIAVSTYLLVAIVKKMLKIELSLYTILQILSVTIVEKLPVLQILTDYDYTAPKYVDPNQLNLFDFKTDSSVRDYKIKVLLFRR